MTRRHHHCLECRQGVRFHQSILCSVERHPRRSSLFHPPSRSYSCACDTHTSMAHGIYVYVTVIYPTFTCHPICTRHSRRSGLVRSPSRPFFCACDTHTYMAHGIYVYVTLIYPICTCHPICTRHPRRSSLVRSLSRLCSRTLTRTLSLVRDAIHSLDSDSRVTLRVLFVLHCVALCCPVFHVLQCVAVCCSVLQCVAVCCTVHCVSCVAVCCSVLQCVAVCCTVQCVSYVAVCLDSDPRVTLRVLFVLQCVVCVLHCVSCLALCCSVFQE